MQLEGEARVCRICGYLTADPCQTLDEAEECPNIDEGEADAGQTG